LPLICFGLFKDCKIKKTLESQKLESPEVIEWEIMTDRTLYENHLKYIKDQIKLGNTYQVNYTLRKHTNTISNPYDFFLEKAKDAPYAALIDSDEHTIISMSPELFFKLSGESLICKPMKGTSKRGKNLHEDIALMEELKNSEKDKAENIMITDMLRNDMGKISKIGSVKVLSEFDIEKYPTVWQMTSSIESQTSASIAEIFEALFPCASVTGAPKVSSMKIISEIEEQPREIYTGAIGYIAPNNEAQFSVPIRTILSDKKACRSVYGTGSGIVWDSESQKEWDECQNKSAILSANSQNFELFETMRWDSNKRIFLEKLHLDRLKDSAEFYNFKFHHEKINDKLQDYLKNLGSESEKIIRLFLAKDGEIRLTSSVYKEQNKDKSIIKRQIEVFMRMP
jgi:para-aminobenzoate synthetase/4-amino-4-deoxychorismate lyase